MAKAHRKHKQARAFWYTQFPPSDRQTDIILLDETQPINSQNKRKCKRQQQLVSSLQMSANLCNILLLSILYSLQGEKSQLTVSGVFKVGEDSWTQ